MNHFSKRLYSNNCTIKLNAFKILIFRIQEYSPKITFLVISQLLATDISYTLKRYKEKPMPDIITGEPYVVPGMDYWPNHYRNISVTVVSTLEEDTVKVYYKGGESRKFKLEMELSERGKKKEKNL